MSMSNSAALQLQLKRRLRRLRRTVRGSIDSAVDALRGDGESALRHEIAASPLLFADKTYNTAHRDYEPELVRNFPGRIHNPDRPSSNVLFLEIRKLARRNRVPNRAWRQVYRDVMDEVRTVPGFEQVMERKRYIEHYLAELEQRYQSHYVAGWVNLVDAQFLYWAVRRTKPRTIVQTGVSNGLSSGFMMLALAKNGPEGRLHVIDIPAIFDPDDPAWTQKGTVYGVVIPQGKSSGWIVPDIYRDRFKVEVGDAKILLPRLVDRLDTIDMFFHDSDHTYHHMTFEFDQAMRKLAPDGVVIADDISWNESLWDFADRHQVPSYNYRGTIGIAFFSGTA
jgi:predicted O-methyltransferase YrrM